MKALILNSGMGKRLKGLTTNKPKAMIKINDNETIISRQLKILKAYGTSDIVITTGHCGKELINYCYNLELGLNYTFVHNPKYLHTNYIYSIFLAREYLNDDIILIHGDLVFEPIVFRKLLGYQRSCMAVSSIVPLSDKDFKVEIKEKRITKIDVEAINTPILAQPLYKLKKEDWVIWLKRIIEFCETGKVSCYAEIAFNEIADSCHIYPLDFKDFICAEIDTMEDLKMVKKRLAFEEASNIYS